MHGNQFSIDNNDNVVPYEYQDTPMTIQAAQQQINAILSGRTTATACYCQFYHGLYFTNQAKREYDEFFPPNKNADYIIPVLSPSSTSMYAKNDDHNACLYHRWNRSNKNTNTDTTKSAPTITPRITTPTYQTAYAPIKIPVKDDPFVTPTLKTLCTLDTCSLHQKLIYQ